MVKMGQDSSVVARLLASVRVSWKVGIHYTNGALLILNLAPLQHIPNKFFISDIVWYNNRNLWRDRWDKRTNRHEDWNSNLDAFLHKDLIRSVFESFLGTTQCTGNNDCTGTGQICDTTINPNLCACDAGFMDDGNGNCLSTPGNTGKYFFFFFWGKIFSKGRKVGRYL